MPKHTAPYNARLSGPRRVHVRFVSAPAPHSFSDALDLLRAHGRKHLGERRTARIRVNPPCPTADDLSTTIGCPS